eukprot:jgi/Chlat1/4919/Chrsp31S04783
MTAAAVGKISLSLDGSDQRAAKQALLQARSLELSYALSEDDDARLPSGVLETARIVCLTELLLLRGFQDELYFHEDEPRGVVASPRNEARALATVLAALQAMPAHTPGRASALKHVIQLCNDYGKSSAAPQTDGETEIPEGNAMFAWAKSEGVQCRVRQAVLHGTARGAVAANDIEAGEEAVSVPQHLLMSYKTALQSDEGSVYKVLMQHHELDGDTIALLWTIRERTRPVSKFREFFNWLPATFLTGLSCSDSAVQCLEGTPLQAEVLEAQQHLRNTYNQLLPALNELYPETFSPQVYSWEAYLWAAQLWYAYGMQVELPDGEKLVCLVPVASLFNHALHPHIINYSKLDPVTDCLNFPVFRRCCQEEEVFLFYGALPAEKLLLFYGFLPAEPNPFDNYPVGKHAPVTSVTTQLCIGKRITSKLLASLRVALLAEDDAHVSKENEQSVFGTLRSIVESLLQPIVDSQPEAEAISAYSTGDRMVEAAMKYRQEQHVFLESVMKDLCDQMPSR